MKKFVIDCQFGDELSPFTIFIGNPKVENHPLHFQADWLAKTRGGSIPGEIMEAISQLHDVAQKNKMPLEDLCVYALGLGDGK